MVIGVFGGAGSGKSAVLRILKNKYKAYVLEADKIAHSLYRKHQPGYEAVKRICGKGILDENREIDRKKLGAILFSDRKKMEEVNAAIHPMVDHKTRMLSENYFARKKRGILVYEAALLPGSYDFFDSVWYVYTSEPVRRQRLKETRGYSDEKIDSVLMNQPSEQEFFDAADIVIDNNKSREELEKEIAAAMKKTTDRSNAKC